LRHGREYFLLCAIRVLENREVENTAHLVEAAESRR
jgi:hypothetical protein